MKISWIPASLLGASLALCPACSLKKSKNPSENNTPQPQNAGIEEGDLKQAPLPEQEGGASEAESPGNETAIESFEAFKQHTFPLINQHCGPCHVDQATPFMAVDDALASHEAITLAQKINWQNPQVSRLYLRLKEDLHNCWSQCEEDAQTMLAALLIWSEAKLAEEPEPEEAQQTSLGFEQAQLYTLKASTSGFISAEAESGEMTGGFAAQDRAEATGNRVVQSQGENLQDFGQANQAPDQLSVPLKIDSQARYRVFARIAAMDQGEQALFVRIDNGNFVSWPLTQTDGEGFAWVASPLPVTQLGPGDHTVEIRRQKGNPLLDAVVLTTLANTQALEDFDAVEQRLRFDLSTACGAEQTLLDIAVKIQGDQSYAFFNPRLQSSAPLQVKSLRIAVNSAPMPQYSTFNQIETTLEPGALTSLQSNAYMIVVKEREDDKYSFQFDTCNP